MVLEKFEQWFTSFMALRGLDIYCSDGRALYQYQMTDKEMQSLKKLFSLYYNGTSLNRKLQMLYGASYCLLASEFYRREYERTWGWDQINKFIGIKIDLLDKDREKLIEYGIQYWKLKVPRDTSGYHGWLLRQGGLPWRLCQKDDDIIFLTIKKLLNNYHVEKQENGSLLPFIKKEADATNLWPDFQKNLETYQLIESIVETLIALRTEFPQLDNTDDPYTFLDRHKKKWREDFPIPLDEKNAMGIINELFKVAGAQIKEKIRSTNNNSSLSLLKLSSNVIWNKQFDLNIINNLKTEILFPKMLVLKGEKYKGLLSGRYELLFYEGETLIAKSGVLLGRVSNTEHSIKIEFPNAKDRYTLQRKSLNNPIKVELINNGIVIAEYLLDDSVIDTNQPLAFVRRDDQYVFVSDNSVSVKESVILVRIPKSTYKLSTTESGYTVLNQQDNITWVQIIANSTLFFPDSNDQFYYKVATSGEDKPFLDGELVQDVISSRPCYLGFPELKNIDVEYQEYVNGKVISESDKLKLSGNINYQVKNNDGQTLLIKRFAVINKSIMLETSPLYINKQKGEFEFRVRISKLVSEDNKLPSYTSMLDCYVPEQPEGAHLLNTEQLNHEAYLERIYKYEVFNLDRIRYRLKVKVKSSNDSDSLELELPLHPHNMTMLENDTPVEIEPKITLTIDDLYRYELRIAGKKGDEIELVYELKSKKVRQQLKTIRTITLVKNYLSINLYGIKDELRNMLSIVDDIDAYIAVCVIHRNIGKINFYVKHHNFSANFYVNSLLAPFSACLYIRNISLEQTMRMEWLFVPLIHPHQLYSLTIDETQVVAEGVFIHFKEKIENEPLGLIITSNNSPHTIRPTLILNEEELDSVRKEFLPTEIEYAITMYYSKGRPIFSPVVAEMLENNQSSNWHYYKVFPHTHLSHYPLSVFEPWKALSKDLKLLTRAILTFGWDELFCQRIQDELGIIFEAIPIKYWKESVSNIYYLGCVSGIKTPEEIMFEIKERLKPVLNICMSKKILKRYIFGQVINDDWKEENKCRIEYLQQLRIKLNNQSTQWPSTLAEELMNWYRKNKYHFSQNEAFTRLIVATNKNINEYAVLLLPIYMAGIALGICNFKDVLDDEYFSYNRSRVQFHELKFVIEEIKAFDREWYEACYQYVLHHYSLRLIFI